MTLQPPPVDEDKQYLTDIYREITSLRNRTVLNVADYGADPTGIADSAEAINTAAGEAGDYGVLDFAGGNYLIKSGISLTDDYQTWDMTGARVTSDFSGTAITIGESGSWTYYPVLLGGLISRGASNDWTAGNVGIRLYNTSAAIVKDFIIERFEKGIQLYADGTSGVQYSNIYPQLIQSCKYGIHIYPDAAGAWCNENRFFGGEVYSASTDADEGYSCYIDHNSATSKPNNNHFFGTAFESNASHTPDGAVYVNGRYNGWFGCRFEGYGSGAFIYAGSDQLYNHFYNCYGVFNTSDIDTTNTATVSFIAANQTRLISATGSGYPGLIISERASNNNQAFRVIGTGGNTRFNIDSYGNFQSFMFNGAPGSGAQVLTGTVLKRGLVDEDPEGNATWTTDTAENIVAAIDSPYPGLSFRCLLHNDATAASGEIVTVAGGTGVTMHGTTLTMTEGTNVTMELIFVLTNVTAASEAVDCYVITNA